MEENEQLQEKFAAANSQIRELRDLIDRVQSDKKLLSDRVSTLSAKGNESLLMIYFGCFDLTISAVQLSSTRSSL